MAIRKPKAVMIRLTADRLKTPRRICCLTQDEFSARIIDMTQMLYRVCYSQLSQGCDREEAVQECLC
jgi:DNA-directed RNA polymerase specialized sigma24 family protein